MTAQHPGEVPHRPQPGVGGPPQPHAEVAFSP
jgi:hypothetical protein